MKTLFALIFLVSASAATAQLKVAALHPILSDLIAQVGGDKVSVVNVLTPGGDLHHFEPSGKVLSELRSVAAIFASGKHLESYLDKLRDTIGTVPVIEVGRPLPSIKLEAGSEVFMCCPAHGASGIDPHWWHSADNMRRAARVVEEQLAQLDAANADYYEAKAKAAGERFEALKSWAQQQFAFIPKRERKLITGHAAFGYFCKEYGFKCIPVLGLRGEDDAAAKHLAETIKVIRDQGVRAAFSEDQANPKVLAEIVRETGVKLGAPLAADGTSKDAHTFETMLKRNVTSIVNAFSK